MTTTMNKQFDKQMCCRFDNMSNSVRSFNCKYNKNVEYRDKAITVTSKSLE